MPYSHQYMSHIIINQISEGLQQFMNVHIYLIVVAKLYNSISKISFIKIISYSTNGYIATNDIFCEAETFKLPYMVHLQT